MDNEYGVLPGKDIENCKTESLPVEDRIKCLGTLVPRMIDTMHKMGTDFIAAPQIGVNVKIFVARFKDAPGKVAVIFDPEYSQFGKSLRTRGGMERSISYPLQAWYVKRHRTICVKYTNHEGETLDKRVKKDDALIFQHATDLLNGITIKMTGENR